MRLKFLLWCFVLFCYFPGILQAESFETHVTELYSVVVEHLQQNGFPGPIAKELAKFSLIRHAHENGVDRPFNYSVPGISSGGNNEVIVRKTIRQVDPDIRVGFVYDTDGVRMLAFYGNTASKISVISISNLFHSYISTLNFSPEERRAWERSLTYSYLLSTHDIPEIQAEYDDLLPVRERILKKCNRAYGPGAERIETQVRILTYIFNKY